MSETRLVRLYIGGTIGQELAEALVSHLKRLNEVRPGSILDGYWYPAPKTVEELIAYADKETWMELKEEEAIQGSEGGIFSLESWLQERRIPYDEHMPPFGELPGIIAYYRPPEGKQKALRVSRNCDHYGNPILEWEEVRKVLNLLRTRAKARARKALEDLLGQDVPKLPHFKVVVQ